MKLIELTQNSPDWHLWRRKGLGASDASVIMGVSKYTTREALMVKKLEKVPPKPKWNLKGLEENARMRRGHDLEPEAIRAYHDYTGKQTRKVCVAHDTIEWLRSSLDGLTLDNTTILEVKCINKVDHQNTLNRTLSVRDRIPVMYWPQVQHQLLTCGLDVLHYWSYSKSSWFRDADLKALVVVGRDEPYMTDLAREEQKFWDEYQLRKKGK